MGENFRHPVNKQIKFKRTTIGSKKDNKIWTITITIISFFLSVLLMFISNTILSDVATTIAFLVVIIIVLIGIVFDTIGIAVTAADETPFHSMAARRFYGAKQAIMLIRNANKVASICNDVVGDICGVISGTAGALIILRISQSLSAFQTTIAGLIMSGLIAAMTVGGKAMGKTTAIENSNNIVYRVSKILAVFYLDKKTKER